MVVSLFQLRKAVVDHVSDSFLETNVPLQVLVEAAKAGNERQVEEYAQVFMEHANKLIEVSGSTQYVGVLERGMVDGLARAGLQGACQQAQLGQWINCICGFVGYGRGG